METETVRKTLCAAFCEGMEVHAVPSGLAVSTPFTDSSGDAITFYISQSPDGIVLEDDGDFLAGLAARDMPITVGARGQLLDAILAEAGAYWDRETLEIKSPPFQDDLNGRVTGFLSALIRVRDLALLTRDRVRSAFRDDFIDAARKAFDDSVSISENEAPIAALREFPADVVLRPAVNDNDARIGAIYLVNSNEKLNEALLAWIEMNETERDAVALFALIEDPDMRNLSRRKFQRAQNRRMPMPIFREDEGHAIGWIKEAMGLQAS